MQQDFEASEDKFSFLCQEMVSENGNWIMKFPKHNFKPKTLKQFKSMAVKREADFEHKHGKQSNEAIERIILSNGVSKRNIYASDIELNVLDGSNDVLNLNKLKDYVRSFTQHNEAEMPGISTPYAYVGSISSVFCWHLEDLNLYSISINIKGKPKN